jgi:hypothetical protein
MERYWKEMGRGGRGKEVVMAGGGKKSKGKGKREEGSKQ